MQYISRDIEQVSVSVRRDEISAGVGVKGINCFRNSIEGEYLEHDVSIDRVKGSFEIDKANGYLFVVISISSMILVRERTCATVVLPFLNPF